MHVVSLCTTTGREEMGVLVVIETAIQYSSSILENMDGVIGGGKPQLSNAVQWIV